MTKRKIIIDTDIADDIDDAMALAFALGSPEFDILGVTVVYGDVETRAKVARKLIRSWGRDIPVKMGFERPLDFNWFPGTVPEKCSQRLGAEGEPPLEDNRRSASQFIIEAVRRHPGEVTLVTIGAMTNVAAALCADPGIVHLIPEVITLTSGCPPAAKTLDWNTAYDLTAAEVLARSGANWLIVGGDVSNGNSLGQGEFDALKASGLPSAGVLLELVFLMKKHKLGGNPRLLSIKEVASASTCDVMALAAMLIPERMAIRRGQASVDHQAGGIDWREDPAGPHRITTRRLAPASYRPEILRRMLTAPKVV